jgi:hypothetical protein
MADARTDSSNRRAFARTAIRQPATVSLGDATIAVQTLDIGHGGLSLLVHRPIAPGTRCSIAFELPLGDGPVPIAASIKVVYSSYLSVEQFKIGAVFTELDEAAAQALERFTTSGS